MAHYPPKHSSSHAVNLIYIDPGAGSMVIQAVLAAALAIPFFFRTRVGGFLQRVRNLRAQRNERRTPGD